MADKPIREDVHRRDFMKIAGGASAVAMTGLAGCTGGSDTDAGGDTDGGSDAPSYPDGDIRYIVPFSEGGGTDTYARQVIPQMADALGTNVAIENIPGAASLRGTGELFFSEPDGYTFGGFNPPSTPVSAMVNPPNFEMTELAGVGTYARTPFVIVANADYEVESFSGLVDRYADGELEIFAGKERGGVDHVMALLMQGLYDFQWDRYVGYDGSGPAVQATIADEVPATISTDTAALSAVESGRADAIVCMSSNGTSVFPDLASVTDEGFDNIDFIGELRRGMFAPSGTPSDVIQTLTGALETALASDPVQEWSESTGNVIEYGGPEVAEDAVANAFELIPQNVDLEAVRQEV